MNSWLVSDFSFDLLIIRSILKKNEMKFQKRICVCGSEIDSNRNQSLTTLTYKGAT